MGSLFSKNLAFALTFWPFLWEQVPLRLRAQDSTAQGDRHGRWKRVRACGRGQRRQAAFWLSPQRDERDLQVCRHCLVRRRCPCNAQGALSSPSQPSTVFKKAPPLFFLTTAFLSLPRSTTTTTLQRGCSRDTLRTLRHGCGRTTSTTAHSSAPVSSLIWRRRRLSRHSTRFVPDNFFV